MGVELSGKSRKEEEEGEDKKPERIFELCPEELAQICQVKERDG